MRKKLISAFIFQLCAVVIIAVLGANSTGLVERFGKEYEFDVSTGYIYSPVEERVLYADFTVSGEVPGTILFRKSIDGYSDIDSLCLYLSRCEKNIYSGFYFYSFRDEINSEQIFPCFEDGEIINTIIRSHNVTAKAKIFFGRLIPGGIFVDGIPIEEYLNSMQSKTRTEKLCAG